MAFSDDPLFEELIDAAVLDHAAAERLLREHPGLIHATNRLGETALHFLAIESYPEGVAFLARHGASVDVTDGHRTPLMDAAMIGASQVVRQLLVLGADPYVQTSEGETVWDCLAPKTAAEMRSILTEHGFEPKVRAA